MERGRTSMAGHYGSSKRDRIAQVVEDVIRRRDLGEAIDDLDVIDIYPGLMPELGDRLRALRRIERAEQRAHSTVVGRHHLDDDVGTDAFGSKLADSLPGYEVFEEIHRGGQGVVYRAVQKATKRVVAIKVMRGGVFFGPRDKGRFDREVRILAQLEHPNIVAIHDSGTAMGHHYFVMDYIAGCALDEYVVGRCGTVDETLRLFARICDAVSSAHLRGIIHRDLKPSNIRVDEHDEPHVLDFGLAKFDAEHDEGSSARAMTLTGQFVGSLPWASPEQADGTPGQIDPRTDVYSLGVVLYQMLTGRFPYAVAGKMRDVLHRILEAAPVKPSRLRKEIDGEVETIVLKCLAKRPDERYQSAASIGEDVRRYLAHQPILAHPPSAAYQLRKLVSRHKLPVALFFSLFVLTLGFAVWMTVLYRAAGANLVRALDAEREAQTDANTAREVTDFLVGLFEVSNPSEATANSVTAREVLDRGAERIRTDLRDQPRIQGRLMDTMGRVYTHLALFDEAEGLLDEALVIQRPMADEYPLGLADTLVDRAWLRIQQGDPPAAETLMREALDLRRAELGNDHWRTAQCLRNLGLILQHQGHLDEAEQLYRDALDIFHVTLGEEHKDIATCLNNLAYVLRRKSDYAAAEQLDREALAMKSRVVGQGSPSYAQSVNNLAGVLYDQQRYDEAEPMYRDSIEILRNSLGDAHTDLPYPLIGLGRTLLAQDRPDEAEPFVREAISIYSNAYSEDDARTARPRCLLGRCLTASERYAEAETQLLAGHALLLDGRGPDHPATRQAVEGLIELYESWGLPGEALAYRTTLGDESDESP